MGGNAKTTEFLKECIADALIKLLKKKPIEKISVPEIAETAQVGRTTYFRNFSSKQEVITFKFVRLWERWAEEHEIAERKNFTPENGLTFFEYNYSIKDLLALCYDRGLQTAIYNSFYEIMVPQYGENALECYKGRFYSYGLFGLLDEWVRRGFHETPQEMQEYINKICGNGMKGQTVREMR